MDPGEIQNYQLPWHSSLLERRAHNAQWQQPCRLDLRAHDAIMVSAITGALAETDPATAPVIDNAVGCYAYGNMLCWL